MVIGKSTELFGTLDSSVDEILDDVQELNLPTCTLMVLGFSRQKILSIKKIF